MKTKEEILGLGVMEEHPRPWYYLNGTRIAFLLMVFVILVNFIDFRLREIDRESAIKALQESDAKIKILVEENRAVAKNSTESSYHNCIVTRALVIWADHLGPEETIPKTDVFYHQRRYQDFKRLRDTLYQVDGIPCVFFLNKSNRAAQGKSFTAVRGISGIKAVKGAHR